MTKERAPMATSDRRMREACLLFAEHDSGREWPVAVSREWNADPENRAEYERVRRLSAELRRLPRPAPPSDEELQADTFEMPDDRWAEFTSDRPVVTFPTTVPVRSRKGRAAL